MLIDLTLIKYLGSSPSFCNGALFHIRHRMAVEYFYWGLTTLLGAHGDLDSRACAQLVLEWELCTKAQLQATDTKLQALLTNPTYNLPTVLPNG
jgi:hypothetical protein|tara:strand:- start:370 stop:651 length:282 start_codon:yes stop_codon:yes gene_type:complete